MNKILRVKLMEKIILKKGLLKRLICGMAALVALLLLTSCSIPDNIFASEWDGNYLYFSGGYKTKTNSTEKIYFVPEFRYHGENVVLTGYISCNYAFGYIHIIGTDDEDNYYYVRYDPQTDNIADVVGTGQVSYLSMAFPGPNHLYLYDGDSIMFVDAEGVYPPLQGNRIDHLTYTPGYLISNSFGLRFAGRGDMDFTNITASGSPRLNFTVRGSKVCYFIGTKYFVYDMDSRTAQQYDVDLEKGDNTISTQLSSGHYLLWQYAPEEELTPEQRNTAEDYGIYFPKYNYSIIGYDAEGQRHVVQLPQQYDFQYYQMSGEYLNLSGYEYCSDGLILHHLYTLDAQYQLTEGYLTESVDTPQPIYTHRKCGDTVYDYQVNYLKEGDNKYYEVALNAADTLTGETYLCFKVYSRDFPGSSNALFVILPY